MTWTKEQCERLAVEKKLIDMKFPGFVFVNPTDSENTSVQGYGKTKSGLAYKLQIILTPNFPHESPRLYVAQPSTLRTYDHQSTINCLQSNHDFHTYANGSNGCVHICYTRHWHAGMTISGVICKGLVWIAAYSLHLKTGQTIQAILEEYEDRVNDLLTQG